MINTIISRSRKKQLLSCNSDSYCYGTFPVKTRHLRRRKKERGGPGGPAPSPPVRGLTALCTPAEGSPLSAEIERQGFLLFRSITLLAWLNQDIWPTPTGGTALLSQLAFPQAGCKEFTLEADSHIRHLRWTPNP